MLFEPWGGPVPYEGSMHDTPVPDLGFIFGRWHTCWHNTGCEACEGPHEI
jgi:hypothetical protein